MRREEAVRHGAHAKAYMRAMREQAAEAEAEAAEELAAALEAARELAAREQAEAVQAVRAGAAAALADHAAVAQQAVQQLPESEQLNVLDQIGKQLLGDERSAACLRGVVVVKRRIKAFKDVDGVSQPDFLQSILEAYGADDGERLPFGSFLSVLMYCATRVADNENWGKSLSGIKFSSVSPLDFELGFQTRSPHLQPLPSASPARASITRS